MKQFNLFFFLVVVSGLGSSRTNRLDDVNYGFCQNSTSNSTLDRFIVQPQPIPLTRGQTFNVTAQFTLDEVIPQGANISIRIERPGLIPIPIPCDFQLDLDFNTSW